MSTKAALLKEIEVLINQDIDINEILEPVTSLKTDFQQIIKEEQLKAKKTFVEAGGEAGNFVSEKTAEEAQLNDLLFIVNERKKKKENEIKEAQQANFKIKVEIIHKINELTDNEDHIGKSFNQLNELREQWKETGQVSPHDYRELQHNYSTALEKFFYNINIHKELQNYDLKRNLQLREELITNMEALLTDKSINNVRSLVGKYLTDWDNIGPISKESWETLRDKFRTTTKKVYENIKTHYDKIKSERQANLKAKQVLLEKVQKINSEEINSLKTFKSKTDEILKIQADWKKIGFATKKENDAIWIEFRTACNEFFDKKNKKYAIEKEKWSENKLKKESLLQKATLLKDSTDWKETSFELIRFQKQWKNIGPANQKEEQRLWKNFRGVCDTFFANKKEYYDTLDDRLAQNLEKKQAFLLELEKTKLSDNIDEAKGSIKEYMKQWNELGMIPKTDIKEINTQYKSTIDLLYLQLGLDKNALDHQRFVDKITELTNKESAKELLDKEKFFIREQTEKLKKEILQYENNLSFLGFSKGVTADKMRSDVNAKIAKIQAQIDGWMAKMKLVNTTIRGLTVES